MLIARQCAVELCLKETCRREELAPLAQELLAVFGKAAAINCGNCESLCCVKFHSSCPYANQLGAGAERGNATKMAPVAVGAGAKSSAEGVAWPRAGSEPTTSQSDA
jgi:hypothetical protein